MGLSTYPQKIPQEKETLTMNTKKLFSVVTLAASLFASSALFAAEPAGMDPNEALTSLMSGNAAFIDGSVTNLVAMSTIARREEVAAGQHPIAVVVACSDSRVSPEILFNKGLGEIFVVRVAGNIVGKHELGSIEYAIEHLGARLVMVLGHSKCGAVNATLEAFNNDKKITHEETKGNIGSLIKDIAPAVKKSHDGGLEACVVTNVINVARKMEDDSAIIKKMDASGQIKIVKAKYDLATGAVSLLSDSSSSSHAH